jgi:hypothetical protein
MRELTADERQDLGDDLHRVIWTWARQALDLEPTEPPLLPGDGPDETRAASHLAVVALSEHVHQLAARIAAASAQEAARLGAGYPELGRAAGISRQAARKRWPGIETTRRRRRRSIWVMPEETGARGLSEAERQTMRPFDLGAGGA